MLPETRYATRGNIHIAYQVTGDGPLDLVLISVWFSHLEARWEIPGFAHLLDRLGAFSRVISFDKYGIGLSDPAPPGALPPIEEWMDDVRTVMDAVGVEKAALLGAARSQATRLTASVRRMTDERRAAASLAERVQAAVLALIRATDPADCIAHEWPGLLGLDAVALCVEANRVGFRPLPPGAVEAALGRRAAVVRPGAGNAVLHGEAAALARVEALVRVPLRGPAALLAWGWPS